ncbi:hypothetical protein, partial [Plasmodium yoelii yoelii]
RKKTKIKIKFVKKNLNNHTRNK